MSEYETYAQSNSHKSKLEKEKEQQEKKVEKVVTGKVQLQKKSGFQKMFENIVSEDASNVGSYIFGEVLIPAIKKALSDIVRDGIDIILYGNTGGRSGRSSNVTYVNYNRMSSDRRDNGRRETESLSTRTDYRNCVFENRQDAEDALAQLDDLIDNYGRASIADLYSTIGIHGNYTDRNYGWTNLRNAEIVRARGGGWLLKLPRAMVID